MKNNLIKMIKQGKVLIQSLFIKYVNKKIETYKENYLINMNREPKDIEVKKFKKDLVMRTGIFLYAILIILFYFFWKTIREGGIFG